MNPAFLIKLHPAGAWRFGPSEGGREAVDDLYRSDRLFSAVTIAMAQLGQVAQWLDATVNAEAPAVVFSSLFPFQGDMLFATPPATLWPPPAGAVRVSSPVFATKVRWREARFVPLTLIETLILSQRVLADQWVTDPESGCLLRRDRPQSSPYRQTVRIHAAVDRLSRNSEPHSLACVEFEAGAGLWGVVSFADDKARSEWKDTVRAAFRLLADTGFGGRRSTGWGQVSKIEIIEDQWPNLMFPKLAKVQANGSAESADGNGQHWLLSLFTPSPTDAVDWTQGDYSLQTRGGFVESAKRAGIAKKLVRMVVEGSVLASAKAPKGTAINVAPEGAGQPSYRAGFALALKLLPVDYSAVADEPIEEVAELQEALSAALRTAAEQDASTIAAETAQHAVEEFKQAESELEQAETEASQLPDTAPAWPEPLLEEPVSPELIPHEVAPKEVETDESETSEESSPTERNEEGSDYEI
jgi:CRISPR type III-A-associated RAMP protein Csm4